MINFLELSDFSFGYTARKQIFTSVNLSIRQQEAVLLTGPNGSGKTSFCRLLTGLNRNYTGSAQLQDRQISSLKITAIMKQLCYLRQEPQVNLIGSTSRQDLHIWQDKFRPVRDNSKEEAILIALRKMSLEQLADEPVWELSQGQLKRAGLAGLLLNPEKFWILDEPTAALDTDGINLLLAILNSRVQNQQGFLIVSHRPEIFKMTVTRKLAIENLTIRGIN